MTSDPTPRAGGGLHSLCALREATQAADFIKVQKPQESCRMSAGAAVRLRVWQAGPPRSDEPSGSRGVSPDPPSPAPLSPPRLITGPVS
ncbi:hypothetical protein AAFF_G00160140 [Aldrovandia affinis]|uniref:Uncharacterized protein n=1 Tax=Aldrovandia affinis TaxID=143900 RepID=A0AAD7W8R5_9TELE|nr:hypothetical protein AAFF_G00160140 [Aldrovandia affinis]